MKHWSKMGKTRQSKHSLSFFNSLYSIESPSESFSGYILSFFQHYHFSVHGQKPSVSIYILILRHFVENQVFFNSIYCKFINASCTLLLMTNKCTQSQRDTCKLIKTIVWVINCLLFYWPVYPFGSIRWLVDHNAILSKKTFSKTLLND